MKYLFLALLVFCNLSKIFAAQNNTFLKTDTNGAILVPTNFFPAAVTNGPSFSNAVGLVAPPGFSVSASNNILNYLSNITYTASNALYVADQLRLLMHNGKGTNLLLGASNDVALSIIPQTGGTSNAFQVLGTNGSAALVVSSNGNKLRLSSGGEFILTESGASITGDRGMLIFDAGTPTIAISGKLNFAQTGSDAGSSSDTTLLRHGIGTNGFANSSGVSGTGSILASNGMFLGRIGAGTNAPQASLHVASGEPVVIRMDAQAGGNSRNWSIQNGNSLNGMLEFMSSSSAGGALNSTRMVISKEGYVGIGVPGITPSAQLEITGIENSYLFRVNTNGLVYSNGIVAINTNAASDSKFAVRGGTNQYNLKLANSAGTYNTTIDTNGNITARSFAGFGIVPIGTVVAWLKDTGVTPALPSGWVECNGQTLSDSESVYDSVTIPDLNGENRFLRGNATSGTTGGAETHSHNLSGGSTITDTGGAYAESTDTANHLPPYYTVVWIMRVK